MNKDIYNKLISCKLIHFDHLYPSPENPQKGDGLGPGKKSSHSSWFLLPFYFIFSHYPPVFFDYSLCTLFHGLFFHVQVVDDVSAPWLYTGITAEEKKKLQIVKTGTLSFCSNSRSSAVRVALLKGFFLVANLAIGEKTIWKNFSVKHLSFIIQPKIVKP